MTALKTGAQIGKTLKNAARLRTIVGVFAKHGFHKVAEKVKLGKFIIERLNSSSDIETLSMAERMRMSFEELGPTFVKLGQLLATRPDLVPEEYVNEFEKLHDRVQPLPFSVVEEVLKEEFGNTLYQKFESIEPEPLGSASIAQVHRAKLATGEAVVVKVQRPGIIQTINDDLNVLYLLADLLITYVPETRPFNPTGIVDEYFRTLELETNFIVEANNIRRFQENFASDDTIKIPKVYLDFTTERVLTMEMLPGVPLSQESSMSQQGLDSKEVIRRGLGAYLKMVFHDGLFHGDLHAGNFFVLPDNHIGLIDFGVVGRLNSRTQGAIANMLLALSKEDYDRLAFEYVDLAPFSDQVNVDLFAKDLRELIAPFFGLTLKNVNLGKILMKSSGIAARHHIQVPTELMMFFKSIVSIEGIGRKIDKDFDFLKYSLEFAGELAKTQFGPQRVMNDMSQMARESRAFLNALPRQLNFFFRKVNSPEHAFKLKIAEIKDLRRSIEVSFNLLFLGVIISALIMSASFIFVHDTVNHVWGIPTASFVGYILAGVLGLIAFVNYIRKP
ncbi:ABC1 kinase family protein [Bdellovibrio svalbardensis]|uniref:AarF/ABC1/UbiB kinase family protein n=1 Tax=Bdellovibrio svalbardensis TaxID=2972972 RepID=A0ABT6DM05_9BACT|nr:AarF/ABC1/UbiB kinase family protein [Bdellovibrio svalbardensis]MDG0817100.1 AarF/ABC1/UbiB kinase family protein [Bdellovibrio svalbardensis]